MTAGLPRLVRVYPFSGRRARLVVALVSAAALVVACGGDEETASDAANAGAAPPPSNSGTTNRAPTIVGAPATQIMQGQAYAFTPSAHDADGDALSFSIANRPSWVSFSTTTGALAGTPVAGDVGTYSNIIVSVSDGTVASSLASFNIQVVATASGSATLTWTSPTQNTDGSPLTDLAGFKVYWGTNQGSYPNSVTISNPGLSTYVVDELTPATWYFAMTAFNASGVESALSVVAAKTVQ